MPIFYDHTLSLWEAGYPAIPCKEKAKQPAIQGWQGLADRMPTPEERSAWMATFPNGNIGLPMGKASGLVAIDIDTEDPRTLEIIDEMLPVSPWIRVGKKGAVKLFRNSGERTQRILGPDRKPIVEQLSTGSQIVLPPSIHPDTQAPYTANCDLATLSKTDFPPLPAGFIAKLRERLQEEGIDVSSHAYHGGFTKMVPEGSRDTAVAARAGLFARDVLEGNRTFLEAAHEITDYVESFTEKVVGDEMDPAKGVAKLIEFFKKDVAKSKKGLPAGWDDGLTDEMKKEYGLDLDCENVVYGARQIIEGLLERLSHGSDPMSINFVDSIEWALSQVARNDKITEIETNQVLQFILNNSKNTLTRAALKRRLKELKHVDVEGVNHTEVANLVIDERSRDGEWRYHEGIFHQWKGAHWQEEDIEDFEGQIAEKFGDLPSTKKHSDHKQVRVLCGKFLKCPLKAVSEPAGLNFANGFLTEDLELKPHHPDQGMTYVLPFCYRPELAGHMPKFNQFTHECWGRDADYPEKLGALQEAIGATLFGVGTKYNRAILLYGAALSGKSTLSDIVRRILPPNTASSVSPAKWHERFSLDNMVGKLANFAGELPEAKLIAGDIFKQITGGESIQIERKNEQPFQAKLQATHWFASNYLPKTKDISAGFTRRWLILEFKQVVAPANEVLDLADQIVAEEAEAIVAWAVEGYTRLRKQRHYTLPASHTALVDRMNHANSSLYYYLSASTSIVVGPTKTSATISAEELFHDYLVFSSSMRIRYRLEFRSFEAQMEQFAGHFGYERFLEGGKPYYRFIDLKKLWV